MNATPASNRLSRLQTIGLWAVGLLLVKVLLAILYEYRWYFPADFDQSAFLSGRRYTFVGAYRVAFYTHIISGPLAILLGCALMVTGGKSRLRSLHRIAGRSQMFVVLGLVTPSGLVMAQQAYGGEIAAAGFTLHTFATAACAIAAVTYAVRRKFLQHRRWATRCFVLLCSPLLLRLVSGVAIVTDAESEWIYRLNAWLSWLIPLLIYELWWRQSPSGREGRAAFGAVPTRIRGLGDG